MRRDITSWYSERLQQEMPLVAYGHYGPPVLMLPTAAADFLEYERFHLIDSLAPWLAHGKAKAYSVNSVNRQALLNQHAAPWEKIEWLNRYDAYLTEEVLPLIRSDCGGGDVKPLIAGISLGAYLAGNTFFRHTDLFSSCLLLSGSYDIRRYMDGYYNESVYFHNPADYLRHLNDDYHLPRLREGGKQIIIFSGQGSFEAPERSRQLSGILHGKGIPHWLDVWGSDVNHDWPWWRKAVPYYFGKLFGEQSQGSLAQAYDVGDGLYELRIDLGPGYRLYLALSGRHVVLLLCGGDKATQPRDIERAQDYWLDYQRRQI